LTNGVETSFFRPVEPALPPANRPRILIPRRLFFKNGVEHFIRAMPLILKEMEVEAVLVGDGPERERLEALARKMSVDHRIRFLGKQPHQDMPALLSSADLVVVPSLMEATSVAALEAMACGVPVVASDVGGLPEIVDEEVGGLFPVGSPEGMARKITAVLNDPDLHRKGERARERVVARWNNERLAERHVQIYEELLKGRG
jgi:glycosyltransferase involved in cell wall biosynthesis